MIDSYPSDVSCNLKTVTSKNILSILTAEQIRLASNQMSKAINKTPILETPWLSRKIEGNVFLKLENMQVSGSFKARGVYLKLSSLTEEEKKRGVIAISTGNHALGVAYHAQIMGIKTLIIMPESTAFSQVENIRQYGASVILQGKNMVEAHDFARQLIKKHNYIMIHPFDDPYVIAGQGTVGIEMLEAVPSLDVLVVPIGGGSLAAGICIAAKSMNPDLYIIGVQAEFCPSVAEILFPNAVPSEPCPLSKSLAQGVNIQFPGELTLSVLAHHLDDCLVVPEHYIELAVESLVKHSKIVAEGSGALGVASLLYAPELFKQKKVGTLISGGNIASKDLTNVLTRTRKDQGRLIQYQIETKNCVKAMGQLSQIIGKAGGQIFELSQQQNLSKLAQRMTYIKAVIEARNSQHAYEMCQALVTKGFPTQILEE